MADSIIKGFPISVGGKQQSALDHAGPSSYTVVTPGSPPTGGDVVTAAAFGQRFIEIVYVSGSDDGTYVVIPILAAADAIPRTQVTLRWFTAASMVEVVGTTNLSARHVRLVAIGG